jgi:hypothetical protein
MFSSQTQRVNDSTADQPAVLESSQLDQPDTILEVLYLPSSDANCKASLSHPWRPDECHQPTSGDKLR